MDVTVSILDVTVAILDVTVAIKYIYFKSHQTNIHVLLMVRHMPKERKTIWDIINISNNHAYYTYFM